MKLLREKADSVTTLALLTLSAMRTHVPTSCGVPTVRPCTSPGAAVELSDSPLATTPPTSPP